MGAESIETSPRLPSPLSRSQAISARRGMVLLGMGLVLPGSAQLAAGNPRLGRWAVRVWLALLALGAVVVLGLLLPTRAALVGILASPTVLALLRWLVLAVGIGWALLLLDAWRLAGPRWMSRRGRLVSGMLALILAIIPAGSAWAASGMLAANARLVDSVFAGGGTTQARDGRYNVLLLGGDAGADRTGLRPDSMTVASIDAVTGRTVLFSLPRNLQWAPFPADSPLRAKYPNGYWCPVKNLSQACLLNGIYTLAEENKKLFGGVKYPGAEATRGVIGEILGIEINYWAMVDMKGFEKLVDAVGGIRLDIGKRVPIGSRSGPKGVYDWIEPGKNVKLDGFHALWFARSREYASDYERMTRQKCVMNAMVKQLNPTTVLTKFQEIADAGRQVVATNLPPSEIGTMLELALKGKSAPMSSISFTPPLIKPVKPDFVKIRRLVAQAIATAEAKDAAGSDATTPPTPASPSASATASPAKPGTSTTRVDNLDLICKVSG